MHCFNSQNTRRAWLCVCLTFNKYINPAPSVEHANFECAVHRVMELFSCPASIETQGGALEVKRAKANVVVSPFDSRGLFYGTKQQERGDAATEINEQAFR